MDIKQLTYFMAVAQAGSFSQAAEYLGISQPALSISVKNLEEELGVKLLYAFGRRQMLTDEGRRLLEGAQQLMDVYQKTVEDVRRTDRNSSGAFSLGLPPLMGACFFGDLIPEFNRAYPNIRVHMIEEGAHRLDQMLQAGELDLALTLNTPRCASFETLHFTTQRNVALVHRDHPLAREPFTTVAALREEEFAIFNENFILNEQIVAACRAAGFEPKMALLTSQWDFMVEMVSHRRAVSILPKPVLDMHPAPQVACVPLMDSMKYWDIVLAWNPRRYLSKACQAFIHHLSRHLPPDDLWPEDGGEA